MTDQSLKDDNGEAVSTPADIEAEERSIWEEKNAKETPESERPDEKGALQDHSDAKDGDTPDGDNGEDQQSNDPDQHEDPAEKIARLEAELERQNELHRRKDGHASQLQRRLTALEQKLKSAPAISDRADEDDPLKGIADDYPELAAPLRQSLQKVSSRVDAMTQAEMARYAETQQEYQATQQEYAQYVAEQTAEVNEKLPDWQKIVGENPRAFERWVEDQPKSIREAAYRNADHIVDASAAIRVIGAFREHITGQTKPDPKTSTRDDRRERQLAGMASPHASKTQANLSGKQLDGDEEAMWEELQARKRRQARS